MVLYSCNFGADVIQGAENNSLLGMPVNFLELPGKFWYEFMLVLLFHDV